LCPSYNARRLCDSLTRMRQRGRPTSSWGRDHQSYERHRAMGVWYSATCWQ
jgi:hypothetical protein